MAESPFHVPFATPLPQHPQTRLRDVSMSMHLGSPYSQWRSQQHPDLTQRLMPDQSESTPFGKRYAEEDSYGGVARSGLGGSMHHDPEHGEQGTMEVVDIEEESWLDRVVQLYASVDAPEDSSALSEFVLGCVCVHVKMHMVCLWLMLARKTNHFCEMYTVR